MNSTDRIRERSLLKKRVYTGSGALLGRVVGYRHDPPGQVSHIIVRQLDGLKEWLVEPDRVRRTGRELHLKGPREGFHIAPLPPPGPTPVDPPMLGAE